MAKHLIFIFALLLLPLRAMADDALADPAQEARAVALGRELRCVVCQSESIEDSQADMARDMRLLVREKISAGWSDRQILAFAQARYGDFILLNPPVQANTYVLWIVPILVLMGASGLIVTLFRQRKDGPQEGEKSS